MLRNFVHFHLIPSKFPGWQTAGCIKLENSWKAARKSCGHFHAEKSPPFLPEIRVEMRGKNVPKPVNLLIHRRMTLKHLRDIFTQLWSLLCPCITFQHLQGNLYVYLEISQDSVGKSRGNIHKENPSLFLLNFNEEIMWKIPRDNPHEFSHKSRWWT